MERNLSPEKKAEAIECIKKKGWTKTDPRWLRDASCYLEPGRKEEWFNPTECYFADGVSQKTWLRFLKGERVRSASFQAFCAVLGLNEEISIPNYIQRPPCEELCWQELQREPGLLRISSTRGTGKTRLVEWLAAKAHQNNFELAIIDFDDGFDNYLNDPEAFRRYFSKTTASALGIKPAPDEDFASLLEKRFLEILDKPLLLILENFDNIFECSTVAQDFSGLIRTIHNTKPITNKLWKKVRIAIIHSTENYPRFSINSSPLSGVGKSVKIKDFTFNQVKDLCGLIANKKWEDGSIQALMKIVGGHPRLLRKAIEYHDVYPQSMTEFLEILHQYDGPYSSHLRDLEYQIGRNPDLKSIFSKLVKRKSININSIDNLNNRYWLVCSGLAVEKEGKIEVRYELYRRYFNKYIN